MPVCIQAKAKQNVCVSNIVSSIFKMKCSFGRALSEYSCSPTAGSGTVIPLLACIRDISAHMSYLFVNSKRGQRSTTLITENKITLNRAGLTEIEKENMAICPKHRRELTVDWSGWKNNSCTGTLHKTEGKAKSLKMPRRVNAAM